MRGGGRDGAVAVVSYNFWQRRFGGAADIVGRTLTIERVPFTIVGVSPAGFFGPDVGRAFDVGDSAGHRTSRPPEGSRAGPAIHVVDEHDGPAEAR